jgi:NitT/TauT family transport system ATP-binding protein
MSNVLVQIERVNKFYGTGSYAVTALRNVSLTIAPDEFVCLLGPSGCGKTTLLNLLAGFELPTQGSITAFGKPITGPGPDRAMVFQEYALFPWLTVADNIQYGLRRKGMPKKEREAISAHYIDLIDLKGFERKYPHQLSGGMRQRVALARALAVNPAMLMMDEPFAALDSFTRERMQDELVRIWQSERKAVVFVTHSIDESIKLADRIVVMSPRPGRIVEVLSMSKSRPRNLDSPENIELARRVRALLHLPSTDSQSRRVAQH